MPTLCYYRVLELVPADETGKWQLIFIITMNFISRGVLWFMVSLLVFSFQLPAMFVVTTVMHELAAISKATKPSLFVVLAYVRLVIPPHCGTKVSWCSDWSLSEKYM